MTDPQIIPVSLSGIDAATASTVESELVRAGARGARLGRDGRLTVSVVAGSYEEAEVLAHSLLAKTAGARADR
jgi:hypothetical protein